MKQLSKEILIYSDENYSHAKNFEGSMYNCPITLNFGVKHNRAKYILHAGTSDHIELWKEGIFIYILSQNNGLGYISLQVINTENQEEAGHVFLDGDITDEIMDMSSKKQIDALYEYIN
jgi:hypothetical protein